MTSFELKVERAYNQLQRDIADTRLEIIHLQSSTWNSRKFWRHSAFTFLAARCATVRDCWGLKSPWGFTLEDSPEFFTMLNGYKS